MDKFRKIPHKCSEELKAEGLEGGVGGPVAGARPAAAAHGARIPNVVGHGVRNLAPPASTADRWRLP
jgi:hypothetical protein